MKTIDRLFQGKRRWILVSAWAAAMCLGWGMGLGFAAGTPSSSDILFYAPFDNSLEPAIAKGNPMAKGVGVIEYVPGHKGKALVTSHTSYVSYSIDGNINLNEGSIKMWVMPMDWKGGEDELFHHFFTITAAGGSENSHPFDLILYRFWGWNSITAYGMGGELTGERILSITMDETWVPKKWHQIVFTWDKEGASFYVDGKGMSRIFKTQAPSMFAATQFTVGGPYFKANETKTAIDELTIYNRKLSEAEVSDMYQEEYRLFMVGGGLGN